MLPEPFAITAFVFGVLGFLNLAREGAEAIHKDVKAYKDIPDELLRILKTLSYINYRVKLWKRTWKIQDDTHADYPHFLWGEEGWGQIQHHIDGIERVLKKVKRILEPFVEGQQDESEQSTYSPNSKLQGTVGAAREHHFVLQDTQKRQFSSKIWWGKKLEFVLARATEIQTHLDEAQSWQFDSLQHLCEQAFDEKHEIETNVSVRARSDIALYDMLIAQAWRSRQTSTSLHNLCSPSERGDIKLELSLLSQRGHEHDPIPFNTGLESHLCYYLTLSPQFVSSTLSQHDRTENSTSSPPLETLVQEVSRVYGKYGYSLDDACRALQHQRIFFVRSRISGGTATPLGASFKFGRSTDRLYDSGRNELDMQEILKCTAYDTESNSLSLRETFEVAYRLAECALLLLGTSWMSGLKSSNVSRGFAKGLQTRYSLTVDPQDFGDDGLYKPQLLRLGQILRELALGSDVDPNNMVGDNSYVGSGVDPDHPSGEDPSIRTDLDENHLNIKDLLTIENRFDRGYRQAVEFCYMPHKASKSTYLNREERASSLSKTELSDFFHNVFLP